MNEPTNPEGSPGSCERAGLLLSLSIDGALTPSQAAELEAHLPACEPCRRAAKADAAVRARLLERADAPGPAWLPGFAVRTAKLALEQAREARSQNRLLWMSAAAAVLVAVSMQFVLERRDAAAPSSETAAVRDLTRLALIRAKALREGK